MAARRNRPELRPGNTDWGKRRVSLGLSQRQAAKLSGVPQPTISLIESGRLIPKAEEAKKLLDLYESQVG